MRSFARIGAFCLAGLFATGIVSYAAACPFCSAPSLTLSEQLSQSDAAVLVQWVGGKEATDSDPGTTEFEVVEIARGPKDKVKKGDKISMVRYRPGKKGDLFLLMGTMSTMIEWNTPLEISETGYQYVAQAPTPEVPTSKRLEYFLKFLENSDQTISNDAYAEFANAPYKDIASISDHFPREKLRNWVADPEVSPTRLGLFGLMLGLCGKPEDAKIMEEKVLAKTDDFRIGIDGVMSGYLTLTGEKGLDVLDEKKLGDKQVPFSETYAAMQALRFMWQYEEGRIPKERLRQSMRLLLDRPELCDLVIADLARWKDWSVIDRLMEIYDDDAYNIPSNKRAIVRYMLVCAKEGPEGDAAEAPEHVAKAKQHLETLRTKDPKTVKEAERFFFIQ